MSKESRSVVYGLISPNLISERQLTDKEFPYAGESPWGGCIVDSDSPGKRDIFICPECVKAKRAWVKEQKRQATAEAKLATKDNWLKELSAIRGESLRKYDNFTMQLAHILDVRRSDKSVSVWAKGGAILEEGREYYFCNSDSAHIALSFEPTDKSMSQALISFESQIQKAKSSGSGVEINGAGKFTSSYYQPNKYTGFFFVKQVHSVKETARTDDVPHIQN